MVILNLRFIIGCGGIMKIFFKGRSINYFDSSEKSSAYELGQMLSDILLEHVRSNRSIVFLCIGSDRATGDSLGPIIGYKLSKFNKFNNFYIYGTLEEPVHAKNLESTIERINNKHEDAFIVAIDAS